MTRGSSRQERLRKELDELLERADHIVDQLKHQPRHVQPERPKLTLIRGGKAVLAAPFVWLGAQLRDHTAQAATLAAAGVVGVPVTLGMATPPEMPSDPEPTSITRLEEPSGFGSHIYGQPTPTPSPMPTGAVEVVESEAIPPAFPAPTSALSLLPSAPLPTETPLPEVVEPVEVWTRAGAVAYCRDVLLALDLHGCVRGLLAG